MNGPVPGLAIVRHPADPRSLLVIHETSRIPVILGCAGDWTADSACRDLDGLLDWTLPALDILDLLGTSPELAAALERIAGKWGASAYPQAPRDLRDLRVSS